MTIVARADIAFGRVAGKTSRVCIDSGGNGLCRALRFVAGGTALNRATCAAFMSGVVKFHIELFIKPNWKGLHRRRSGLQIVVADHADSGLRICKFIQVAIDARIVSGKF